MTVLILDLDNYRRTLKLIQRMTMPITTRRATGLSIMKRLLYKAARPKLVMVRDLSNAKLHGMLIRN